MGLERGQKNVILTGARCRFAVKGITIGYATNVTVREAINYQPAEVLDNIETEEHVPVGYEVSMTAGFLRIISSTLKTVGLFPKNGGDSNTHLLNILNQGAVEATITDRVTDQPWATAEQVKISERNTRVESRGLVGEDVTLVAIRLRDESELT